MSWGVVIFIGLVLISGGVLAYWLRDVPELHPDDEDGMSDSERARLKAKRDHEATKNKERGPWG